MNASTCWWAFDKTEGWTRETPGTPPERIDATDTYGWLPGGFALPHSVDAHVGDRERHIEKVRMLERWTAPSEDRPAAMGEKRGLVRQF
jgi:hypothetical protein